MGGKRARRGKYVLLYLACAGIVLTCTGCAGLPQDWGGEDPLAEARERLADGRYEEALAKADSALQTHPSRFGDKALFLKGLVLIHTANPNADLESGLDVFRTIGRRFPESPLREEADLWVSTVREILDTRKRAAAASEQARVLKARLARQETACRLRERKVQRLRDRIRALEDRIEQMKRVDMELEKQKQKTLP
ncbi:MAG: hypothetical protein K9M82_06070 [Deltaproteobacteria bacterium]|nr:hypothetical protein [Deltaproteobacteria bacterium]